MVDDGQSRQLIQIKTMPPSRSNHRRLMTASQNSTLKITFANARGDARHLGPFTRLLFDGPEIKDDTGRVVAVHRDHQWEIVEGPRYSRLECYSPCRVRFEPRDPAQREPRNVGPFSTLSSVDGVCYGDHRILAFCDDQLKDWYSFDFGQHYGRMVVVPLE